jgi:Predicted aminopeptidases
MLASCTETDYKAYFDGVVKELSSDAYCGRSNIEDGNIKAGQYIMDQLKEIGIAPLPPQGEELNEAAPELKSKVYPGDAGRWTGLSADDAAYLQNFKMPMNVMRGAMSLSVDGVTFEPTVDFVAKEFSPSCKGTFPVAYLDEAYYSSEDFVAELNSGRYSGKFVVIDWQLYQQVLDYNPFDRYLPYIMPLTNVAGLILKQDALFPYFKARTYYTTHVPALMVSSKFPSDAKEVTVDIESEMLAEHDAHNVIGYLPGKDNSGKRLVFIAHYDHLGVMGEGNIFPGANDNASGVAMLLALAKYYKQNTPELPMEFIFLDTEENNLLGAFFYCENPRLPLENIKYLLNFDMIGDNGKMVCQSSDEGKQGLELFKSICAEMKAPFTEIEEEAMDDNSDHFAFGLKGVPCAYFTFEGDYYQYYHTPRDNYENYTDEYFEPMFEIVKKFIEKYN